MKKTYRLLEIEDKLINNGKPYWRVEKKVIFWWTQYFGEHLDYGTTFYEKSEAETWYNYHIDKKSRIKEKVILQKTI